MRITETAIDIAEISEIYKGDFKPTLVEVKSRLADGFIYVLTGGAEYTFDGKLCQVRSGDVMYLAKGSHYFVNVSVENYTYIVINFYFNNPENVLFKNEVFKPIKISELYDIFLKMLKLSLTNNHSDALEIKSLLYHVYSVISSSNIYTYTSITQRQQLEAAREQLLLHAFDSELSITDVINNTQISAVHFRRLFKQVYGVSPIKYVRNIRINQAKKLLMDKTIPISKISEECGYSSNYYFSRSFKEVTKMTPSEYRASSTYLT